MGICTKRLYFADYLSTITDIAIIDHAVKEILTEDVFICKEIAESDNFKMFLEITICKNGIKCKKMV